MVTDRIDIPVPRIPGPIISNRNFASNGEYRGIGDPNGIIPADIGAKYLDESAEKLWLKVSGIGTKTGWEPDSDADSPVTATGTTTARTNADRWSEVRNVKDFGVVADGTTNDYTAFVAALAAVDVLQITGVVRIGTNLTIASSKVLIFEKGGKLKPSSGIKIIVNGEIQAGRFEIFDYTAGGKVCLGFYATTKFIFPEWYGAFANNDTNNDTPFSRIFDTSFNAASENRQQVLLGQGYYNFIAGFTATSSTRLLGAGSRKTRIQLSPASGAGTVRLITLPSGSNEINIHGIQLNQLTATAGVRTIAIGHADISHHAADLRIRDCIFSGFNQAAIDIGSAIYLLVESSLFENISNRVALGGTGDGSATCLNVQNFAHAVTVNNQSRSINCEQFLKTASSASLLLQSCSFEQSNTGTPANGATDLDAITNRSHFIEITSGGPVHVDDCYFEGVRATSPKALIYFKDCNSWIVSGCYMTGHRGAVAAVTQLYVFADSGCAGGFVFANEFYGTPSSYITNNATNQIAEARANVYRNDAGTQLSSYGALSNYITPASVNFTTNDGEFTTRPIYHRSVVSTAGMRYPLTIGRTKNGSAGANGDGVGIKYDATRGDSTIQPIGEQDHVWITAASPEVSDYIQKILAAGTLTEGFRVRGSGGITIRGGIHTTPRESAIDTAVTQADGVVYLTATANTATIQQSTSLPIGFEVVVKLNVGGAATGTVAFTNGTDRIQPENSATYSLSADGKYVRLQLVKANVWAIVGNN